MSQGSPRVWGGVLISLALGPGGLGVLASFTSQFRGDPPLAVGDDVSVLYPPERPSEARLAVAWLTWGSKVRNWAAVGGALALALSAALAVAGWIVIRRLIPSTTPAS